MSRAFDAFHLPGLDAADPVATWAEMTAGDVRLRYPLLSAREMHTLAAGLRASRARVLEQKPVAAIIESIDAAARLLTEDGELRALALDLLPHVTRMSPPMVELILDRMAVDWQTDALERLIAVEIGGADALDGPDALDGFVEEPGAARHVRALGPRVALNIFAGNVPGVAVTALIRCLLVKAAVIGKTAADDPVLPVLFARALHRVDPALAECVAVVYWPGGRGEAEAGAIGEADTIVVYGGADVVKHVRKSAAANVRILEHGPRMSLGFVARGALRTETAAALARDIARAAATFDQHGCVSLHGALIERGGAVEPREMARMIFDELLALEQALPPGRLRPEEAANLHAERARAEFAAMDHGGELLASPGSLATVAYSERPDAMPSCLDRFVRVSAVDDLLPAIEALVSMAPLLQTAGLAAPGEITTRLADALGRAGFTRVTSFAAMPWPPAHWHHDGASPLRELVRWVDLET